RRPLRTRSSETTALVAEAALKGRHRAGREPLTSSNPALGTRFPVPAAAAGARVPSSPTTSPAPSAPESTARRLGPRRCRQDPSGEPVSLSWVFMLVLLDGGAAIAADCNRLHRSGHSLRCHGSGAASGSAVDAALLL